MEKQAKIQAILEKRDKSLDVDALANYEEAPIPDASPRFHYLMDIYYQMLNSIDMEYPYWYNRMWWQTDGYTPVIRRAISEAHALSHMTVTIWPQELIVGNKTKNWRGAFCFPWVDASFFNAQAEALLNNVEPPELSAADAASGNSIGAGGGNVTKDGPGYVSIAQKFGLRREEIPCLVKVSEYWKTNSVEEISARYTELLPDYRDWKAYRDTVLIMFDSWAIPQGRECINYYYPLQYGFDGLIAESDKRMGETLGLAENGDGILGMNRGYYYYACKIIAEGVSKWIENYAKKAEQLMEWEQDEQRKAELADIATVMHNIAHKKPETFREALQLTLMCHFGVVNEDPHSGQSIGRLGQILEPFYQTDLKYGRITEEEAIELLELYRIKITSIECFASSGVTGGVLSGNTFNNLAIAGLGHDGLSAVGAVDYLIVEAGTRAQTTQPTLSVLYDEKNPEDFLMLCARCCKQGMGYPAWMNNQQGMNYIMRNYGPEGMDVVDARAWTLGGCLESTAGVHQPLDLDGKVWWIPGGAAPTSGTGIHFTGLPKFLELILTNGVDMRTGIKVFEPHNSKLETYDEVWRIYTEWMAHLLGVAVKANNLQMDVWRKNCPPAWASLLKAGCFIQGQHQGDMGAWYNACINFESCGTVTFINAMASLKKNVYDTKKYTIEEMTDAILNNFGFKTAFETGVFSPDRREAGPDAPKYEKIFFDCVNAPKFGNADPYVDDEMVRYEEIMKELVPAVKSYYGKPLYMCQISVSTHGPQGAITLADAGGRLAGTTYSDGSVSPAANTDKNGIYAVFESATCYDVSICQNSQMNVKIHPTAVKGQNGTRKLLDVIRAYMRKGGFHVQFNITSSDTLRKAQAKPDEYRDLMVRVAGFTQYWCEIGKPIQDEVIFRTEYDG